ncbi:pdr transporter [Ochromonadaceae sp. CCMP2298]|nr:pdr transporter [Ochromonadaceae sp. CCMP2298]
MQELLRKGNEKPLEMDDLYKLSYSDSAEGVYQNFKEGWTRELQKPGQEPSLAWAFFHAFGTPFLAAAVLKFIHDSALFVGPQLLNALINFLEDPEAPLQTGLLYVLGLFLANLVMSICLRQYFWWCYRVGMNLRSSVVTAVYSKALVISVAALSRKTLGEITNLMSVDSSRLQDLTPYLHAVWYSLYQVAVALYFLYQQMGVSCVAGMAVILLTIPLTGKVSLYLKTLQKKLSEIRDERIKLTNEVLAGMKVIKLQAWEREFEGRIQEVRARELFTFRKYSIAVSMSGALYTSIPLMVSILTFTTYIALGNSLDVATALTSLALFDLLRFPLFMLPQVLNNLVEAKVSVDRVQSFLLESEKQPIPTFPLRSTGALLDRSTLVWESAVKRKEGPGQLVSVVGAVGSGKSSILQALLGDMRVCYGTVAIWGSVAYASQLAFVQNSTLKENIIYGSPYDEQRYQKTLEMCALLQDIAVLPAGHETEIGERGINLSGGQKARLGLARAVYSDADIYLLDDPLSAVDAHVGQHLFEQCILHLKRQGKCVLMVTNALQFCSKSTHIIVLKDGRVSEAGRYEELLERGGGFSEMISTMQDTGGSKTKGSGGSDSNSGGGGGDSSVDVKKSAKLISTEDREVGNVDYKVYMKWSVAAGGLTVGVIIIALFALGESLTITSSWWLSYWSEHRYDPAHSPWFYLGIYTAISLCIVALSFCRELYVRLRSLNAGRGLFLELLGAVLYSPMAFYDTTPLGRVINRFSKDIYTIDEQIPQTVRMYLATMAKVISTVLYIILITPLFMVGLVPIIFFYYIAQRYYINTSRELTRLENTSRSPIYALFSETLDGLPTIRAYKSERRLILKNNRQLDANVQSYFLNFSANCWLAVRLEFAGTLIVTFAALFAVLARNTETSEDATNSGVLNAKRQAFAGLAGLAISFAMSVTQSLNWTVRMASDMESQMVSVERVKTYATMPQEAPHFLPGDPTTANAAAIFNAQGGGTWPSLGAIEMRGVAMRYREGLPLVLRGLSLAVAGREKVGIVGRTGAGKSSLLTALLRLVELESGEILIDGVNISTIGLNTLRSVMAVIPQDPVLFSGTVRSNLDPFGRFSDEEVWDGLRRTLLAGAIGSLEDTVTENGSNFSVGQRQLLCIARALLSQAKIIIMDEATAAVDVETDAVIQQAIRTEFAHATCLTVAHRLNTIMDSDKVLVMDQGIAAEYDSPANLLADKNSMFYSLVQNWENSK